MILMSFKIRVKPTIGVKRLNAITKQGFANVGLYWDEHMLPNAFAAGAARRHHHKPRSRKWREKKVALAKVGVGEEGGTRNLVFTGETRRSIQDYAVVRAFPRRVRVTMIGPRYITMTPKDPNMPNMGAEITHCTPGQVRRLMAVMHDSIMRGINTTQDTRTYTVG